MLDKLMKDLNEMNRTAQVYYKEEQWALLDKMMEKIMSVMGPDFDLDGGFEKYMKIRDEKGEDAATEYVGEEVLKAFKSKQLPLN